MYHTCLFCNQDLGRNEIVEHFPVGHRLAYDAARGRLWVVCRACERWNLTPLEERWEAIEECERLFRSTRLRVGTDNVGLARVGEGTELVRIGAPTRPELAVWRYGDQFGRRRRRWLVRAGKTAVAATAVIAGGAAIGAGVLLLATLVEAAVHGALLRRPNGVVARLPGLPGERGRLRRRDVESVRVWGDRRELQLYVRWGDEEHTFSGDIAARIAAPVLRHVNDAGAGRREIEAALRNIDAAGDGAQFVAAFRHPRVMPGLPIVSAATSVEPPYRSASPAHDLAALVDVPRVDRLALEMVVHEARERRALEGELAELAAAWREAEEIAAIADGVLTPLAPPGGPAAAELRHARGDGRVD